MHENWRFGAAARRLPSDAFDARTERQPNGCLLWTGPQAGRYGSWGRHRYAHREAYERAFGPIPPGAYVLHRCDTPFCVEPTHAQEHNTPGAGDADERLIAESVAERLIAESVAERLIAESVAEHKPFWCLCPDECLCPCDDCQEATDD